MRPLKNNNSEAVISVWKSPVPYLFGGLGLVLALMSVALIILFCSHRKRASSSSSVSSTSSSSSQEQREGDGFIRLQVMAMEDSEPKILVIMAGDENPTYLAKPIVPLSYCTCDQPQLPTPSSSSSSSSSSTSINNKTVT